MSLRSELERPSSPIRLFLEDQFPLAGEAARAVAAKLGAATTTRPDPSAGSPPWSQIGMAVGYRLGFAFGNQRCALAEMGASALGGHHRRLAAELVAALDDLGGSGPTQLLPDPQEDRLVAVCWALALYETICRVGPGIDTPLNELGPKATLAELLGLAAPAWVADIKAMTSAAAGPLVARYADVPLAERRPGIILKGGADLGGADADLLLGSTLIELKTTTQTRTETRWVHQLVGYALLDYDDEWGIDQVGFYFPRQAVLVTWELQALLRRMRPVAPGGPRKPAVDLPAVRARLADTLRTARLPQ